MAKKMSQPVDPWQAEDDARTIMRSAEIMNDKSRKTNAMKVLKTQQNNISSVLDKPKTVKRPAVKPKTYI